MSTNEDGEKKVKDKDRKKTVKPDFAISHLLPNGARLVVTLYAPNCGKKAMGSK